MTTGYYCAIFPFCGGGKKKTKQNKKKKTTKKKKAFYDWATTGIPIKSCEMSICMWVCIQNAATGYKWAP